MTDVYTSTSGSVLNGDTTHDYIHWDGNAIAYTSSNYVNGFGTAGINGVDQVFIGNFATYVPSTFPGGGRLSVNFRDQSGTRLECGGSPFNNVCGTSNVGTPIVVQIEQPRADGYQIGMTTIQGVRAYDPGSAQWTTPDAYAGVVTDPMSQQSYMWTNNNPIAYTDPSGYCVPECLPEIIEATMSAAEVVEVTETLADASALTKEAEAAAAFAKSGENTNVGLRNAAKALFQTGDNLPGGTANAIRTELITRRPLSENAGFHLAKGAGRLNQLSKLLKENDLSPAERNAAQALYNDLKNAFNGMDPSQFLKSNYPPTAPEPEPNAPPRRSTH